MMNLYYQIRKLLKKRAVDLQCVGFLFTSILFVLIDAIKVWKLKRLCLPFDGVQVCWSCRTWATLARRESYFITFATERPRWRLCNNVSLISELIFLLQLVRMHWLLCLENFSYSFPIANASSFSFELWKHLHNKRTWRHGQTSPNYDWSCN